jgi:membrane-bound transcription factor site-1 protease
VERNGLSLIVVADWFNQRIMEESSFFNNNTSEEWKPVMAGANIPSLNALL